MPRSRHNLVHDSRQNSLAPFHLHDVKRLIRLNHEVDLLGVSV